MNEHRDPSEFDEVWRRLESVIRSAVSSRQHQLRHSLEPGLERQIAALTELGVLSPQSERELQQLRKVRNVWAHDGAGTSGVPLAVPTEKAVERMLWFADAIERVPRAEDVMPLASTCVPDDPVLHVLSVMRTNDFDAIPYRSGQEWFVFTRHQVAHWLELEAQTSVGSTLMLDVGVTVGDVAALVGACRPRTVGSRNKLPVVVQMLTEPPAEADVVSILLSQSPQGPRILTPADLPRLVARLVPPA